MADRVVQTLLRLVFDHAEAQRGIRDVQQLRSALVDMGKAADQTGVKVKAGVKAPGGKIGLESLRRTGGALSQLGLGAIGAPIARLGDIGEIAKTASAGIAAMGVSISTLVAIAAPAAILIAAFAIGLKAFNDGVEDGTKRLKSGLDTHKEYYDLLASGATTAAVQKRIEGYKQEQAAREAALAETEASIKRLEQQTNTTRQIGAMGVDPTSQAFRDLTTQLEADKKAILDNETAWGRLEGGLKSGAFAANDAAAAEEKLTKARLDKHQQELDIAVEGGDVTAEQARDKIKAMENEAAALKEWLDRHAEAAAGDEAMAALFDENEAKLDKLNEALRKWRDEILPTAEATEKLDKTLAAHRKFNDQIEKLDQDNLDAITSIHDRYNDALVQAAADAVEAATNALEKLEQQRADLATGLARDQDKSVREANDQLLENQIKAQRQERDDLVAHLRRLQDIRNQNQADEQQAVWDRNALALIQLRLSKTQQMEAENTEYQRRQEDRQQALSDEITDQQRAQAISRRERQIAYQQANQDAQQQYERELVQAAAAKQKTIDFAAKTLADELKLQADKTTKAKQLAADQAKTEITQAQLTSKARISLLQAEMEAAQKWAAGLLGGGSANAVARAAAGLASSVQNFGFFRRQHGGIARAGGLYQVNDDAWGRTESFNGASFPPGLGLFRPLQTGMIQSGSAGKVVNLSIPITVNEAANGMRTVQLVRAEIDNALGVVFGNN